MRDRVLLWAVRDTSLMIMSYQALSFLWYVVVAQFACTTVDSQGMFELEVTQEWETTLILTE
jgi:hypothetical protein